MGWPSRAPPTVARRTRRSTTEQSRASPTPSFPRARCSSIPRPAQARTMPGRSLQTGWRRCALPRRDDIESICLIGSGPIVIGQASEFDYAGWQGLKILREDGVRTIGVNSNPATIMTDPGFADRTYLEPLDLDGVTGVLERERPDALLPTMGGQTALNLARELHNAGVLDELGVELVGARIDAIARAEDRLLFKEAVESCGLQVPSSRIVTAINQLDRGPAPPGPRPAVTPGGRRCGRGSHARRAAG